METDTIHTTTPQGLLVKLGPDPAQRSTALIWANLVLTRNHKSPTNADHIDLQFENLGPKLTGAFQTHQQFLVISLNKDGVLGAFDNEMSIEGWPFILDVAQVDQLGNYDNVLIFKYCKGSLLERVQNPSLWTNARDFNAHSDGGLNKISSWLTDYVQEGIDRASSNPDYLNFRRKVRDPNWNGILALKTNICLKDFPPQLQGLLCGIDQTRFKSHHFGVNANHVIPNEAGELVMDPKSSLFGLIDYEDLWFESYRGDIETYKKEARVDTANDFDFKVLQLKVLFDNSKIEDFQSHVQLVINRLFKDKVKGHKNANLLILNGSYEDHNGVPTYIFNEFGDNKLDFTGSVLTGVEILKAAFNTIIPHTPTSKIHSRFSLWGYLNFAAVEGFDLFSFGSPMGFESQKGLAYSNLGIDLSFDLDTPTEKTLAFDPRHVAFDGAISNTRPGSLFPHFPLKLLGLTSGCDGDTPTSQGYLNVDVPDLTSGGTVSGDWYGLVFDLNMGTLGPLAAVGGFKAALLAAWCTDSGGTTAVGIRLPGVNTKSKMCRFQGVLKLDIAEIKLLKGEPKKNKPHLTDGAERGQQTMRVRENSPSYLMMMNGIALKFLGVKIPPGGDIDFYLFGEPAADAKSGSLDWYAAYEEET